MNRKLKKVTAVLLVLMLAISVSVSTSLADGPAPINDLELFEELLSGDFEDELLAEELENSEPLDLEGETAEMEEEESELIQESALVDVLGYPVTPLEELEGSGTRTDPYKLYTEPDLRAVVRGNYYEMMNDITLSGTENNWTPIGAGRNGFTGQFDGRGHTIRNIQIDTDADDQGFFGAIGSGETGGAVKNLNIKDSSIKGKHKVGGIVGNAMYSFARITGCSFEGSVTASGGTAGGIAGYVSNASEIVECYNKGTVSGSEDAGGIVGEASFCFVYNCHNEGDVYAGRFVGGIAKNTDAMQCLNTGNIFSMNTDTGSAGGIAGDERVWISSCISAGNTVSSANSSNAFRISPASSSGSNYALESMLVNGSAVSGTRDSVHGQDITKEQLASLEFYQTNLPYWDFDSTWMIDPVKGHPVLQWTYEPPEETLPWPTDSSEITLWFGKNNPLYSDDENMGVSIQGSQGSPVYSICDGVVDYAGYVDGYKYVVHVNFEHNGEQMQVRYGHLDSQLSLAVGQQISQGDLIGQMAADDETGMGLLAISMLKISQTGLLSDGETMVDPLDYMERPYIADFEYLSRPMATLLDTMGVPSVTPDAVLSLENSIDLKIRYRKNLDLSSSEAYLRKIVLDYAHDYVDKTITSKNFERRNILSYNSDNDTATVRLNNRVVNYSPRLGNARYANGSMVVNKYDVWYDLIGNTYSVGGTWKNNKNNYTQIDQQVFIPQGEAYRIYVLAEGSATDDVLLGLLTDVAAGKGVEALITYASTNYGLALNSTTVGRIVTATLVLTDIGIALDKDAFRNCVMDCPEGQYVMIQRQRVPNARMTIKSYHIVEKVRDPYGVPGTFTPNVYDIKGALYQ